MTDLVDLDWAERKANEMRRDLSLTIYEPFDPHELAKVMEVAVVYDKWLKDISPQLYNAVFRHTSTAWSGATLMFPNGEQMVLLNHSHSRTRTKATLAEELAHIHIGHPASLLIHGTHGGFTFDYNPVHEAEAYWVGAAALATREQLQRAQCIKTHTIQSFAEFGGISPAIVRFRCDKTGISLPEASPDKKKCLVLRR